MSCQNRFERIDLASWPRAKHFRVFSASNYSYVGITAEIDVTPVALAKRERGIPVFKTLLYAAVRAANELENFRYRLLDGSPVIFSRVDPSWTVMKKGGELFYFAVCPYVGDFREFSALADAAAAQALAEEKLDEPRTDLAYFSSLPWRRFLDIQQPVAVPDPNGIPRFAWGRWEERLGRFLMPLSILGHHGFIDGLHLSRYADRLEEILRSMHDHP